MHQCEKTFFVSFLFSPIYNNLYRVIYHVTFDSSINFLFFVTNFQELDVWGSVFFRFSRGFWVKGMTVRVQTSCCDTLMLGDIGDKPRKGLEGCGAAPAQHAGAGAGQP
jgi:hypothetical protein